MKKAAALTLALALCLALAVPAAAFQSDAAGLTPEIAAAYLAVLDAETAEFGAAREADGESLFYPELQSYLGACGGYLVDLGGDGLPELVTAHSTESPGGTDRVSYVRVYYWDGAEAARCATEFTVTVAGAGTWRPAVLLRVGAEGGWLCSRSTWISMSPEADVTESDEFYRLAGGDLRPVDAGEVPEGEDVVLCAEIFTLFRNMDELRVLLAAVTPPKEITVTVCGAAVVWTDVKPFIDENDRTMVPLRAVAEAMEGVSVDWDDAAREAVFTRSRTGAGATEIEIIFFPIGSRSARFERIRMRQGEAGIVNERDSGAIGMDTAAVIRDSRTYAPVRYLAEFFGYTVGWDGETRTVALTG